MASFVGALFLEWDRNQSCSLAHVCELFHLYKEGGKELWHMIVFFGSLRSQKRKQRESKGPEPVPCASREVAVAHRQPHSQGLAPYLSGSGTGQIHLTSEAI
jgi:hypothetical protein